MGIILKAILRARRTTTDKHFHQITLTQHFHPVERTRFREQVQKGSNKRCKKVSGAPKRCKQVRGVFEKVQTGARRFRFRCKKGFSGSGAPAHRPGPRTAMMPGSLPALSCSYLRLPGMYQERNGTDFQWKLWPGTVRNRTDDVSERNRRQWNGTDFFSERNGTDFCSGRSGTEPNPQMSTPIQKMA